MYKYVPQTHISHYKAYCQEILDQLQRILKEEYTVRMYSLLIGSGAANMVTKNGKAGFDLDYTLLLTGMPRRYDRSPKELKDLIRRTLDGLINENFSYGQDSASSITYLVHSMNGKRVEFSFDIALIRQPKGFKNKRRLIHDKENDVFIWKQIPLSRRQDSKAEAVKNAGLWKEVRKEYLDKKNLYLQRQDNSQPSYVIYNEVINQVYQSMKGLS